jgi:hypothetical protein
MPANNRKDGRAPGAVVLVGSVMLGSVVLNE